MTKVSNSVAYASGLVYILVSAAVDQTEVSYGLMLLGIKSTLLALRSWCGVNVYECLLTCTIFNFSERNKFKLWKESHFRKGDMDVSESVNPEGIARPLGSDSNLCTPSQFISSPFPSTLSCREDFRPIQTSNTDLQNHLQSSALQK